MDWPAEPINARCRANNTVAGWGGDSEAGWPQGSHELTEPGRVNPFFGVCRTTGLFKKASTISTADEGLETLQLQSLASQPDGPISPVDTYTQIPPQCFFAL